MHPIRSRILQRQELRAGMRRESERTGKSQYRLPTRVSIVTGDLPDLDGTDTKRHGREGKEGDTPLRGSTVVVRGRHPGGIYAEVEEEKKGWRKDFNIEGTPPNSIQS